ncbi:MAG: FAD-dependent oxidoreductase [Candidatus Omnitrophica bacterium]|nr:FAD-dependent oxidoreductase [Candidatus Omnitrophota bacterium]
MKKVIFLGHSILAVKTIELLKQFGFEGTFTIFCPQGSQPYWEGHIPAFLSNRLKLDDLYFRTNHFYSQDEINVVTEADMTRINLVRRKIHTEQKNIYNFDILVLTHMPHINLPDIKGINKKGIFNFRRLKDAESLGTNFLLQETVILKTNSLYGLAFAGAIAQREIETIVICEEDHILRPYLPAECSRWLQKRMEEQGVRFILQNDILDILGDSDVKAIRLKTGKVIACQAVGYGECPPDLRLLRDSELHLDNGITAWNGIHTSLSDIYVCDTLANPVSFFDPFCPTTHELDHQAKFLASKIVEKELASEDHMAHAHYQFGPFDCVFLGQCRLTPSGQTFVQYDDERNTMIIYYARQNGEVTGIAYMNVVRDIDLIKYKKMIEQKTPLTDICDDLSAVHVNPPEQNGHADSPATDDAAGDQSDSPSSVAPHSDGEQPVISQPRDQVIEDETILK